MASIQTWNILAQASSHSYQIFAETASHLRSVGFAPKGAQGLQLTAKVIPGEDKSFQRGQVVNVGPFFPRHGACSGYIFALVCTKKCTDIPAIIAVNVSEENIDMVSLEIVYIFIRLSM